MDDDETKTAVERVKANGPSISVTISKLLRKSAAYLNFRDRAALKELKENMALYISHDMLLADKLRKLYHHMKKQRVLEKKHADMLIELKNDLPIALLEEAGVSKREFD